MKKISFLAKVITFLNLKNTAGTLITMPRKSTLKSIFFISYVLGIKTKKLMEQTFDLGPRSEIIKFKNLMFSLLRLKSKNLLTILLVSGS